MTRKRGDAGPAGLFHAVVPEPLAARMRPRSLDEVAGQLHLLGPGRALRHEIETGTVGSMLFWGPPGSGKTTLGRLIARHTDRDFVPFSAVSEGVPRIRQVVSEAESRRAMGRGTVLFVDEIHRLNKAQQDAFLPFVETGLLTLVGATTENPSFEVNGALLSRMRVYVLQPLTSTELRVVIERALADTERGLGAQQLTLAPNAMDALAEEADGDARRALTVLEAAARLAGAGGVGERREAADAAGQTGTPVAPAGVTITLDVLREALQRRVAKYDKGGEEHYNLISAYHKALRGSDPQGALYWLARMIAGGEDPLYIARRTVRFASEDVGLADPDALRIALAARDAYHFLGSPEGELAIAEAAVYLATAPKSNKVYEAWRAAQKLAADHPAAQVPLHLRNAPTKLMKELGYGDGYQYAHAVPEAYLPQDYLPDEIAHVVLYEPGAFGFEKEIAKRLAWWKELRDRVTRESAEDPQQNTAR